MGIVSVFIDQWAEHLWDLSWQISIIIGMLIIIELLQTKMTPLIRYCLWGLVLVRLCLPFDLIASYTLHVLQGHVSDRFAHAAIVSTETVNAIFSLPTETVLSDYLHVSFINRIKHVLFFCYMTGVLCFAVYLIIKYFKTKRLIQFCTPVDREEINQLFSKLLSDLNISSSVVLLSLDTNTVKIPVCIGFFYPRVLISQQIIDVWSPDELEPILLHELQHIKHYDSIVGLIQTLVQVLYFFNPLVWYAGKRIGIIREELCDDRVVRCLDNRVHYAHSMLKIMLETVNEPNYSFAGVGFYDKRKNFVKRIDRILLDGSPNKKQVSFLSIIVLSVVFLFSVSLAYSSSNERDGRKENLTIYNVANNEAVSAFSLIHIVHDASDEKVSIQYTIADYNTVALTIYDRQGKEIEALFKKKQEKGCYVAEWETANIENGLYFFKLTRGDQVQTKQVRINH